MKIFDSMQRLLFISFFVFTFVVTVSAQNRSGTYYDRYDTGDVTFREVTRGKNKLLNFEFSVSGATRGTCIGYIKGKAKWIDKNVAEYNGDFNEVDSETGEAIGCRLTFTFSGNRLVVREHDCDSFHGASCSFEGTFKRPSNANKGKKKSK